MRHSLGLAAWATALADGCEACLWRGRRAWAGQLIELRHHERVAVATALLGDSSQDAHDFYTPACVSLTHAGVAQPTPASFGLLWTHSVPCASTGKGAGRREVMVVSWVCAVLLGGTPIIAAVCRDLVSLCGHAVRWGSIERIIRDRTGVIRVVDRTGEGDVLDIEILPSIEAASGLDLGSAEA
jgi:hypothetical protein